MGLFLGFLKCMAKTIVTPLRNTAINQTKQLKCKMWAWFRLGRSTETQTNSFSESRQRLHVLSLLSWAAQLYELWNLHLDPFDPHRTFTFTELQRAAHSAKLQCLFLFHVEIKQSYREILWLPIPAVFRRGQIPSADIPEAPAHRANESSRSSGGGGGWMEGSSFSKHTVSQITTHHA